MMTKYLRICLISSVVMACMSCTETVSVQTEQSENVASLPSTSDYPSALLQQVPVLSCYGTVYLFSLNADRRVYLKKQNVPGIDGETWPSGQIDLGTPDGVTLDVALGAGMDDNGKISVFGISNSGSRRLFYRKQTYNTVPVFDDWKQVNWPLGYGAIEVVSTVSGLFVFTKSSTNKLYCIKFATSGTINYKLLGTETVGNFTVQEDIDGYIHIFASTPTCVRHIRQTVVGSGSSWGSWEQIGPTTPSTIATDADIQCCINQGNGLEVFINTTDQKLYNCWQEGSGWATYWLNITGSPHPVNKRFNVAKRGDGGLDLIYLNNFDQVYRRATLCYYYQLPGSVEWKAGTTDPVNPLSLGLFNFQGLHYLQEGYPDLADYRISLLYNRNIDRLQLFVPSNYIWPDGTFDYFLGINWENDSPEPYGWVSNMHIAPAVE